MPETVIVVPARLDSQRFPRKLLFPVAGRPLILHTADNLKRIADALPVTFAVAEPELQALLEGHGHATILTDPSLASGTDRVAAANRKIGADRVINVQADEPVISKEHLQSLVALLDQGFPVATLATPFSSTEDFHDPNKVKVVRDGHGKALYFSRSPIPHERGKSDALPKGALWHMGVYAYTADLLQTFTQWQPARLEQLEKLEQLRLLENGQAVGVGLSHTRTVGIDVPEDVEHLARFLQAAE